MKIWRISQSVNREYDTFDSAVVAAKTEAEAVFTPMPYGGEKCWAPINDITAELLGTAKPGTKSGLILASFNAG